MDEHQLFETALAATMKDLDFLSKRGTEDSAQIVPLQEGRFCCFADRIRQESNLSVSSTGTVAKCLGLWIQCTVTPWIVAIGRSAIQLRAVRFSNACLVPPLELGDFYYSMPDLNLSIFGSGFPG